MPEGRFLLRDPLIMMESSVNEDNDVFLCSTAAEMSATAMRTNSCGSLPDIPEVAIPPPLFNPLPLQCLAANALPDEVKSEIESVITLYSADSAGSTGDACDDAYVTRKDASAEEDDSLASSGETAEVIADDCSADCRNAIPVKRITLRRDSYSRELVNDLGIGAHITGGLKCDGCGRLHAVVTAITGVCSEELHEGLCVVEWCGQVLEGATYEEVRRMLCSTEDQQEIELAVKDCSKLKWPQRGCRFLAGRFATLRADMRRKKKKGNKQTDISHVTPSDSCLTPTDDHVTTSNGHVTDFPGPSLTPSANLEMKQLPASTLSLPTSSSLSSSLEEPSRSSSSLRPPTNQKRARPRSITLPASKTTQRTERRSAVPDIALTDDFGDFFASLPNGMIQVSFEYKCAEESLEVVLHQVKVRSSRELENSSDVFINTYLIPDERDQGVRSCKVASRNYSVEKPPTYTIKEDELDSVALRVILWEANNGKNGVFQGEVLLSLSDSEIVNLEGRPTWFTICSEDPNLPRLPKPVHYKQKQRLEHLLGQALSYLKQHTFKLSSTQQQVAESPLTPSSASSLQEKQLEQTATVKRRSHSKRQRQIKATRFGSLSKVPKILDVLSQAAQLELDTDASGKGSDDSSKLARLSMVVKVLRDATMEEPLPDESLQIEKKKQSRLSTILQVLQDAVTTDLVPPETPSTVDCLQPPSNDDDSSFSILDRKNRERPSPTTPSEEVKDEAVLRDYSNSFSVIPDLRESLHANRKRVTVYSFITEIEKLAKMEGETGVVSEPEMDSGPNTSDLPQEEARLGEVAGGTISLLPSEKDKILGDQGGTDEVDMGDSETVDPTNSSQLCTSEGKQQFHPRAAYGNNYSSLHSDCSHQSAEVSLQDRTDSPAVPQVEIIVAPHFNQPSHPREIYEKTSTGVRSDCNHQSAEVSLQDRTDSPAVPQVEITVVPNFATVYPSEGSLPKRSDRPTLLNLLDGDVKKKQTPIRSRSMGSLENLESDEEYSGLQSPLTPSPTHVPVPTSSEQNRASSFGIYDFGSATLTPVCEEVCADPDMSSLDVGARNSCTLSTFSNEASQSSVGYAQHGREETLASKKRQSWKKTPSLTRWKSFDDLLGSIKSKSKKHRSNSQEAIPPPKSQSLKKATSFPAYGYKTTGSLKLELQFSEHSSHVLHTLKLVDFVLMSSKSMSLDYNLKACLYHSSSGMRLLKKKTRVKMRSPDTDGSPLAVLQFDTDIPNLSLQVSLVGGGRLFSRKIVGQILIDLDSLDLDQQHTYTKWFQLTKLTSA